MANMRSELLDQLSADWEEGRVGSGWPKVSWLARRLEELGEPAMTDEETAQYCGTTTVTPPEL